MTFERGQLIANRFRLLNPIGRGALGELWRAADRVPDRQVAIRRVDGFDRDATRGMLRELDASRAIREPYIARVHRVGVLEDGAAFVATELLMAESLAELLARRERLPSGAALALISQLARAVAEAHERRIAHRAICPRAVLLHREPTGAVTPKLVDFGRAALGESVSEYSSPEQLIGARVGYETDVWSLGVVLLRCVAGDVPFESLDDVFDARRIVERADVHEHVRSVLLAALEPNVARRCSATELADNAQINTWKVPGGFRDLEKMVRIRSDVWLDASATGAVDHFPTIPSLGGGPPPRETEPPHEVERITEVPDSSEEVDPSEVEEVPSMPAARYVTPIPDEVFIDFRERRRRVLFACAVGGLMILCALGMTRPHAHRARLGHVAILPPPIAPKPAPRPAPKPTVTAVPVLPAIAPRHAAMTTPMPPRVAPAKDDAVVAAQPSYPVVGVPLWDSPAPKAPPAKTADDSPYE